MPKDEGLKNLKPFLPGWKGGPGRPKGSKCLSTELAKLLDVEVPLKDKETGEIIRDKDGLPITKTTRIALSESIIRSALKGNVNAWREIADRTEGKAVQKMELSGNDGEPIQYQQLSLTKEQKDALVRIQKGE